jgi:tetratricopeptide (TPR) repeat protein
MWLLKYEYAHDEYGNSICSFFRERIVKRSLNLKWHQPIHEYIPLVEYQKEDIEVHHSKSHPTSERNIKILEDIVKKNPDDARNVYYLGKEYIDCGRVEEGFEKLETFVSMPGAWKENIYAAFLRMSDYKKVKKQIGEAKDFCLKAIGTDPMKAKAYCHYGELCMSENDYNQAIHWYKIAANMDRSEDSLDIVEPKYYTWLPNLQLCIAYNALGKVKEAAEANEKALESRPEDPRMLNNQKIFKKFLKDDYPVILKETEFFKEAMKYMEEVSKEPEPLPEFKGKLAWYTPTGTTFASNRIRMININDKFKEMGYDSEIYNPDNEDDYDVIVTGKEYNQQHLEKIKDWRSKGITVIGDINEDILEFPLVVDTLKNCDYVVCCSRGLYDELGDQLWSGEFKDIKNMWSNIFVIEDALDYEGEL